MIQDLKILNLECKLLDIEMSVSMSEGIELYYSERSNIILPLSILKIDLPIYIECDTISGKDLLKVITLLKNNDDLIISTDHSYIQLNNYTIIILNYLAHDKASLFLKLKNTTTQY